MDDQEPPILNYADAHTDEWIAIARFPDEITARLASSKLDAAGIEAIIENALDPFLAASWTSLAVQPDNVKAAIAILTDSPAKRWLVGQ